MSVKGDRLVYLFTLVNFLGCVFQDSVDLKNICLRMAVSERGYESDRNLKELRLCLQLIVNNLLSAVRDHNHLSSTGATRQLMGLSITLPDI